MNKKLARKKRHQFKKRVDKNAREITKAQTWNKARLEIEPKIRILDESEHHEYTQVRAEIILQEECALCKKPIEDLSSEKLFIFTTENVFSGYKYFTHVEHYYTDGEPNPGSVQMMIEIKTHIINETVSKISGLRIGVDFARPEPMQTDRNGGL